MPFPGGSFADGVYYFQQFDFPGNPNASRKIYALPPGGSGFGNVLSATGMDAGAGLAFAPLTFGPILGGQLFGSDSGNAPGFNSGDGIRRWDAFGNFTNEVMGPIANNPDSYTDVTFTGPEFGAFSNRLVAVNMTGTGSRRSRRRRRQAVARDRPTDTAVGRCCCSPSLRVTRPAGRRSSGCEQQPLAHLGIKTPALRSGWTQPDGHIRVRSGRIETTSFTSGAAVRACR